MVADCVQHHKRASEAKCCDVNVQVQKEFEFRLRTFEPSDRVFSEFEFNFLQYIIAQTEIVETQFNCSCAFFPHTLHVPVYLGKCTIIV